MGRKTTINTEPTEPGIINIQDVIDFCFCPKFAKLKNNNTTLLTEYNKALYNTYYSFLHTLIKTSDSNKLEDAFERLKVSWGKEWIKENDFKSIQILPINPNVDTYSKRRRMGIDTITNFYKLITLYEQYPITINKQYKLKIDNFYICGNIDYIREVKINNQKRIQAVKILPEETRHCAYIEDRKGLDTIAMYFGFKQMFDIDFDLILLDPNKNKMNKVIRTEKQYNMLVDACRYYKHCKDNNIYFISPDSKCGICEYKNKCFPESR